MIIDSEAESESPLIEFSRWDDFSDEDEDPSLAQFGDINDIEYQMREEKLIRELQLIQDRLGSQDIRPQKRQYSIDSLDSDPRPKECRYPSRKRQLPAVVR
jgi:hypothetical protein